MSAGPLAVEIVLAFCLAAALLYRYANWKKHHVIVTGSVLIAWYFSFLIAFILPLDVSSTAYRQCLHEQHALMLSESPFIQSEAFNTSTSNGTNITTDAITPFPSSDNNRCEEPLTYVPDYVFRDLWRIVYWTSQCLTWIILPMMQSYTRAGDFTVLGKLKSSLVDNAIYYGSYLLIFGILLIYIAVTPGLDLDGQKLKVICVTASNTWGLFLLVLLLGYGLVEVPRGLWNSAKRGFMLNYTYFKVAKLSVEKAEAEECLEDALEDIQRAADTIRSLHPLRCHVETILAKVPESMASMVANRQHTPDETTPHPTETPTEKSLVRLHRQLIKSLQTQHRTQTQWSTLVDKAIGLEDVARNELNRDHTMKHSFPVVQPIWQQFLCNPAIEWYWKCVLRAWVYRVLAVMLTIFSVFVVWSEVTFFNKSPTLSLFAVFVNLARKNYDYFYIELVSTITIAYLCTCAYFTIFKIRVLNYYYLAPYHQTDEYSLIFSGMLLCRLTPPMCLNFLGLIHLDSHITSDKSIVETSYTSIMGHMDVISFISDGFNIYLPIAILLLCLATYFHLGSHLLHVMGFQQFVGDDDITTELVEEGKELIKREKRKRQRMEEGEMRRRQFQEKLTGNATFRGRQKMGDDENSDHRGTSRTLQRSNSTDSARAELLRDIEPVDYMSEGNDPYGTRKSSAIPVPAESSRFDRYQSSGNEQLSWQQSSHGPKNPFPPRGIFDDV